MIKIIAYILNLFGVIVNPLGLIGLCGCMAMGDFHILPIAGGVAIVGLIFGTFAYRLDIPPRWFWSKSANSLFEFSVTAVLGYAWSFAAWAFAIYLVNVVIDKM